MNQGFAEKLADAGWNKIKLIALMDELDAEKRSIKTALTRIAQDPEYSMTGMGRARQNKERRIKERQRYLIEEREIVQRRIGKINREMKTMNRMKNEKTNMACAFYAAAEQMLDQELFTELELRAVEILGNA